jgi:hypothetical protein
MFQPLIFGTRNSDERHILQALTFKYLALGGEKGLATSDFLPFGAAEKSLHQRRFPHQYLPKYLCVQTGQNQPWASCQNQAAICPLPAAQPLMKVNGRYLDRPGTAPDPKPTFRPSLVQWQVTKRSCLTSQPLAGNTSA